MTSWYKDIFNSSNSLDNITQEEICAYNLLSLMDISLELFFFNSIDSDMRDEYEKCCVEMRQ
jgi:hypothetical protein